MLCCPLVMCFKIIAQDEHGQFSTSQEKLVDTAKVNILLRFTRE